jgi:hypothetical protein
MATPIATATAPTAPGRLGTPLAAQDALRYLEELGTWRDQRRAELDRLDEAALQSGDPDAFTADILLSMALWKAVADRHDLLLATWDSGRVGPSERERLATLVWGRLDTSLDPRLAGAATSNGVPGSGSALAVSLPEACRLSDALAASLRVRLSVDPADADVTSRVRSLRAQVERIRDLTAAEPAGGPTNRATRLLGRLDERVADLAARAHRGADVGGLLGPLEGEAALAERDLIVGASRRREDAKDQARARALGTELEARGAALRDLAARCVAAVHPAPRFAVPDVAALGPVPEEPAAVDAYLARLETVGRAMTLAQAAYAGALERRDELSGRLEAYRAKGAGTGPTTGAGTGGAASAEGRRRDLAELYRRARDVLDRAPADLPRAEALLAAYQAYLGSGARTPGRGGTP